MVNGIWREFDTFYSSVACLVLGLDVFKEEDCIRDFEEYTLSKNGIS
jgi:hypothetical protein